MKPRLPISSTHISPPVDLAFLKSPFFWTLQFFNTIQALGYFLPTNYLPTIAESLGLGRTLGSLTILCVNLAGIFGCIGVGALVDRFDVGGLVVGLPLNMDGTEGPRAQATRSFVRNLATLLRRPALFWDERLSTMVVTRTLLDAIPNPF